MVPRRVRLDRRIPLLIVACALAPGVFVLADGVRAQSGPSVDDARAFIAPRRRRP